MKKQQEELGGAYFDYLFDGQTSLLPNPEKPDEQIYFEYLKKRFSTVGQEEGTTITITAEEIATVLRLAQAATLTKQQLQKDRNKFTATIASDTLLDDTYTLLEQLANNRQFLEEIDKILGTPENNPES